MSHSKIDFKTQLRWTGYGLFGVLLPSLFLPKLIDINSHYAFISVLWACLVGGAAGVDYARDGYLTYINRQKRLIDEQTELVTEYRKELKLLKKELKTLRPKKVKATRVKK